LNIIEYLFCERLFGQVLLIEKSAAEKVRQKSVAKKCGRKITTEKVRQEKCVTEKPAKNPRQQNATRRKRYGFHMCSVEFMNLVEGFPCKSVGCPLGSLGLVVELI
jgi:regulator of replication initiation timing